MLRSRRRFFNEGRHGNRQTTPMRPPILAIIAMAMLATPVSAAETTIGLAAPLSDAAALLGRQMQAGADAAAERSGGKASLMVEDTGCSAEGGAAAARRFAEAKVSVVTGFLCVEAIEAALPVLKEAGIPVITTGVRVDSLTDRRDKTGWPVFRLAPRADEELAAVSRILTERWRNALFAIVDDGTIYGRELAEGFRLAAEESGLKPVFTDTFRPQLDNQVGLAGRLRRAGATHVFVGGDRSDVAILGRDAAQLGYPLVIAGGEALRAARDDVDLAPGTLMIGLPEWSDIADADAMNAILAKGIQPEGYVAPAYAAVEVAIQASEAARAGGGSVLDALTGRGFTTVLGDVRFNAVGDWSGTRYRLFSYDGSAFREVEQ